MFYRFPNLPPLPQSFKEKNSKVSTVNDEAMIYFWNFKSKNRILEGLPLFGPQLRRRVC